MRRSPKPLLVEVSKQLEQEAMPLGEACVVASSFQYEWQFTASTASRYQQLAQAIGSVCAMGQGLTDVVVLNPHFSAALLANDLGDDGPEQKRMFEYALTYERETVVAAAHRMLARIGGKVSTELRSRRRRTAAAGPRPGRGRPPGGCPRPPWPR